MIMDITALYIRLSLEDVDLDKDKKESTSIQNQRLHLSSFLMSHPDVKCGEIKEFVDDGYSGTNFDRPAFQEMLDGIRSGQVKCILVKDFSRLGRNYIKVGNYLEQIFPLMGVRFVSVDDRYDSKGNRGDVPGLDVVFKNIIHDHYSKELSHKVIQVKRNLAQKGLFLSGIPPYGYLKDPQDKYHLVVDPDSAKVVRQIFALALEGEKYSEIARILNQQNIESPAKRLWRLGIRRKTKDKEQIEKLVWHSEAVVRLLQSEVVLGSVTNHRVERKQIGKADIKIVCKEDNIVVPNMHEPIIDQMTFDRVQALMQNNKITKMSEKPVAVRHPLSGIMKCAYCGKNLILEKGWYVCRHSRYDAEDEHKKARIKSKKVLSALGNIIFLMVELHGDESPDVTEGWQAKPTVPNKVATDKPEAHKMRVLELYEMFSSGQISKEAFLKKKEMLQRQLPEAKEHATRPVKSKKEFVNSELYSKMSLDDTSWISRELLKELVSEVRVNSKMEVKIIWKCTDWNK